MDGYKVMKTIGRGSFGIVHLYERLVDGKQVVIKQIPTDHMTTDEEHSTNEEVKVLSMLNHPNITEYFTSFQEGNALSIVVEYAAGGTLSSYLKERAGIALKKETVINYFCQMLMGLQHIHSLNIIHRDLTTCNIFLTANYKVIKIGDFGISKILLSKSKANSIVGSPCYMSPELCQGRLYNYKSDVWALGCILYEMLTLRKAFEALTIPSLIMKIMSGSYMPIEEMLYGIEIVQIVHSMLHIDENMRPNISMIIANPAIIGTYMSLFTDLGNL